MKFLPKDYTYFKAISIKILVSGENVYDYQKSRDNFKDKFGTKNMVLIWILLKSFL